MRFNDRVKALALLFDEVIVIGSGLLDQLGLRQAHDVDLAAKKRQRESETDLRDIRLLEEYYVKI